jgi:hypothetical protein
VKAKAVPIITGATRSLSRSFQKNLDASPCNTPVWDFENAAVGRIKRILGKCLMQQLISYLFTVSSIKMDLEEICLGGGGCAVESPGSG